MFGAKSNLIFFLAPLNYSWLRFCKQKEKYLLSILRNILPIIIFLPPFSRSLFFVTYFCCGNEFLFKLLPHFCRRKCLGSAEWRERKAKRFIGVLYALWSLYHFEMVMGITEKIDSHAVRRPIQEQIPFRSTPLISQFIRKQLKLPHRESFFFFFFFGCTTNLHELPTYIRTRHW